MEFTGLFLALYFSICGGFLLDGKTQPPPTQGSVITDSNYNFLMQFIFKERQSRLKLEAEMKHLKEQVTASQADLNSKIDQLKRRGCAADTTNRTHVLEGKVNTLQQNIIALTKDNINQKHDQVLIQNKSVELEHEVISLKQLKGVSDLTTVLDLRNQSKHLETEIQITNSRLSAITAEANARKQDFLALFHKVQTNEEYCIRKTGDINKQLNKTSQLFESNTQNLNSTLTQIITNLEKETDMLNKTIVQNEVNSSNRMDSIDNRTTIIQNTVDTINDRETGETLLSVVEIHRGLDFQKNTITLNTGSGKALVSGHLYSKQYSDGDVIKINTVVVSRGIRGISGIKSTGKFTCEKSGYYLLSVFAGIKSSEHGVFIMKNTDPLARALKHGDNNYDTHSATMLAHLNVGDSVYVKASGAVYIYSTYDSMFSVLQVG